MRKLIVSGIAAAAILSVSVVRVEAKPEFAKKEKTGCVTCHVSNKSKELNDTGKIYKEKKELPKKS